MLVLRLEGFGLLPFRNSPSSIEQSTDVTSVAWAQVLLRTATLYCWLHSHYKHCAPLWASILPISSDRLEGVVVLRSWLNNCPLLHLIDSKKALSRSYPSTQMEI